MLIFKGRKKFITIVKRWLLFKKISIKASTYYRYKYIINKYIIQYFKDKSIYFFINYDFSIYIQYLSKTLAPKTVIDIITVLKSILKYIERKYNLNYKLDLISMPKKKINEVKVLNKSESDKLCLDGYNTKYIGIVICLNTGLRIGEICALKWKDIDLKQKLISVNKTIQRVYKGKKNTQIQIDEPKTYHSIRKIPISNKLLEIFKEIKKNNTYDDDAYFLTCTNKVIEPRNYYDLFKNCLQLCNISDYNFHVLRHTFATNCIKIGMDVKSLSEILGHSNVSLTLNRYVHSSYSNQKSYLDKL